MALSESVQEGRVLSCMLVRMKNTNMHIPVHLDRPLIYNSVSAIQLNIIVHTSFDILLTDPWQSRAAALFDVHTPLFMAFQCTCKSLIYSHFLCLDKFCIEGSLSMSFWMSFKARQSPLSWSRRCTNSNVSSTAVKKLYLLLFILFPLAWTNALQREGAHVLWKWVFLVSICLTYDSVLLNFLAIQVILVAHKFENWTTSSWRVSAFSLFSSCFALAMIFWASVDFLSGCAWAAITSLVGLQEANEEILEDAGGMFKLLEGTIGLSEGSTGMLFVVDILFAWW